MTYNSMHEMHGITIITALTNELRQAQVRVCCYWFWIIQTNLSCSSFESSTTISPLWSFSQVFHFMQCPCGLPTSLDLVSTYFGRVHVFEKVRPDKYLSDTRFLQLKDQCSNCIADTVRFCVYYFLSYVDFGIHSPPAFVKHFETCFKLLCYGWFI